MFYSCYLLLVGRELGDVGGEGLGPHHVRDLHHGEEGRHPGVGLHQPPRQPGHQQVEVLVAVAAVEVRREEDGDGDEGLVHDSPVTRLQPVIDDASAGAAEDKY